MAGKNGNGNGNGHRPARPDQVVLGERAKAVEMFLEGASVADIARKLGVGVRTATRYVENAYFDAMERDKAYFDKQIASWFDQKVAACHEMSALLADREFLQTAEIARLEVIRDTLDVVTGRVFALMSAVGASRTAERLTLPPATGAGDSGHESH